MTDISPSSLPIQQESVQFNNPVSEASAGSMGAAINYLLQFQQIVGACMPSMLTEPQLQNALGNPTPATWVLADGRDVTGSQYQALTGQTNIPDLRGQFVRGLNNGGSAAGVRNDGLQNSNPGANTYAPGQEENDQLQDHDHDALLYFNTSNDPGFGAGNGTQPFGTIRTQAVHSSFRSGNETNPKNVSMNWFIRIN